MEHCGSLQQSLLKTPYYQAPLNAPARALKVSTTTAPWAGMAPCNPSGVPWAGMAEASGWANHPLYDSDDDTRFSTQDVEMQGFSDEGADTGGGKGNRGRAGPLPRSPNLTASSKQKKRTSPPCAPRLQGILRSAAGAPTP